jgi:hypothetical protein
MKFKVGDRVERTHVGYAGSWAPIKGSIYTVSGFTDSHNLTLKEDPNDRGWACDFFIVVKSARKSNLPAWF